MDFMLSRATRVTAQWASAPVQHAVARFWRDMEMTLSTTGFVPDNRLMICLAPALPPESYTLDVTENQLTLCAADDLGAVYGLLDISRHYLGVAPFWFWNQQQFEPKPFATVPEGRITGPAAAVGLRGWDLSDAPWLSAWADATENGWEMIFESLLRYRGNMVRTDKQADLAAAMGLRPVQNPQTPLGAAPQQAAAENPEERHKIWQDSIRTLKTSPRIWALGIDGMGGDPDGTASTAALQEQWQLLNATVPGAAAYILLPGCSYAGRATTPLWQEQVVFSVRLYLYSLRGAVRFCTAREQFLDKDWQNCFCTLGRAADDFGAMAALLQPKTGFWAGFCSDTMLDGALTARVLTGLMAIPRAAGDGPDYAAWQAPLPGAPAAPVPDFTLYRALVQAETKKV